MASTPSILDQVPESLAEEVLDLYQRIEPHDPRTAKNALAVCELAIQMSEHMDLPPDRIPKIGVAALLHDIGKLEIAPAMLTWPAELDDMQWEVMKTHVEGAEYFSEELCDWLEDDIEGVFNHHEYFGGRGYPSGDVNNASVNASQIIGVVSAYVAMINDAPYREAMSKREAMAELQEEQGGFWNPAVVSALGEVVEVSAARYMETSKAEVAHSSILPIAAFAGLKAKFQDKTDAFHPGQTYISFGNRARSIWESRRLRIGVPIAIAAILAIVVGELTLSGGKEPINAANSQGFHNGLSSQLAHSDDTFGTGSSTGDLSSDSSDDPLFIPGLDGGGSNTSAAGGGDSFSELFGVTPSPTTSGSGSKSGSGSGSSGGSGTTGTTKASTNTTNGSGGTGTTKGTTATTKATTTTTYGSQGGTTLTTKATTTTTKAPTTTTAKATAPAGYKVYVWHGCALGIRVENANVPTGGVVGYAYSWIRQGDGCTATRAVENTTGGSDDSGRVVLTGRTATAQAKASGLVNFSYHYIRHSDGQCARYKTSISYSQGNITNFSASYFDGACP
jgi:hypothetical protein